MIDPYAAGHVVASVVDKGGGLQVPNVEEMFGWPDILFKGTPFALNKVGILYLLAALLSFGLWSIAGRRARLIPHGVQAVMEPVYEFIRNNIVMEVMGRKGLKYVPFLVSLFTFILFCNLFEITPGIMFPPTSSIAIPALLAILVWVVFNVQGIAAQGLGKYLKSSLFPPGVPWAFYFFVVPIELIQLLIVRPLSLAVRLFANMVAGHTLVTMFLVFTIYNIGWPHSGGALLQRGVAGILVFIPSFIGAIGMFGFEIFVSFIQAFIFTMLAAVYIGQSLSAEH